MDAIPEDQRKRFEKGTGCVLSGNTMSGDYHGHSLLYVDNDNNISFVYIKEDKIESLDGEIYEFRSDKTIEQLKELGFTINQGDSVVIPLAEQVKAYKGIEDEKILQEKKNGFNF